MFERYTEKARRVIFFARYEASQFGAPAIEPEHLLLGLIQAGGAAQHACDEHCDGPAPHTGDRFGHGSPAGFGRRSRSG